ncbi:MAG: sigma-70 family RNA polymerase sigma factor [Verrucomicrobia bacterium]|nr:sigma-70 family RNA polymerase sigma factor [Verrucomicrobiota bacterium]
MNDDDIVLLRRYAETRDEAAFAELVRRHLDLVYGAALRQLSGATHRAEEVAQSVFTDLAHKAAAVAGRTDLVGWLYTSTHFAAAKLKRGEQRRQRREEESHTMNELLSNSAADADWQRLRPVLDEVMHELPQRDRDVILQRFFEGRRLADVGARLGLSEDAARMRVDRALDKLRTLLARRSITSTTAALGVALANQPVVAVPAGLATTITGAALASSAPATGALATWIQFMTTSKLTIGVVGAALLAAVVGTTAYHERGGLAAAEADTARSAAAVAQLDGRLRDLQQRTAAAEREVADARTALAAAQAPAQAARPAGAVAGANANPAVAGKAFLDQHPEARELWDERERANLAAKLAPVYRRLSLAPAQQAQVEAIMLGATSGTTTVQGPAGPMVLRREPTLTREQAETQLQGLLGTAGYERFQEEAKFAPTFDLTVKLATALYRTEPLNASQTAVVMQLFADASPVGKNPGPNGGIDWSSITTQAAAVLTPGQLAALEGLQRNFEFQQAQQRIIRTEAASKSAPAPTR